MFWPAPRASIPMASEQGPHSRTIYNTSDEIWVESLHALDDFTEFQQKVGRKRQHYSRIQALRIYAVKGCATHMSADGCSSAANTALLTAVDRVGTLGCSPAVHLLTTYLPTRASPVNSQRPNDGAQVSTRRTCAVTAQIRHGCCYRRAPISRRLQQM